MPVLIVHGDADRIVPVEVSGQRAAKLLKRVRLDVIEGAPHGLTATHGPQLNRLMLDFLRS